MVALDVSKLESDVKDAEEEEEDAPMGSPKQQEDDEDVIVMGRAKSGCRRRPIFG